MSDRTLCLVVSLLCAVTAVVLLFKNNMALAWAFLIAGFVVTYIEKKLLVESDTEEQGQTG